MLEMLESFEALRAERELNLSARAALYTAARETCIQETFAEFGY